MARKTRPIGDRPLTRSESGRLAARVRWSGPPAEPATAEPKPVKCPYCGHDEHDAAGWCRACGKYVPGAVGPAKCELCGEVTIASFCRPCGHWTYLKRELRPGELSLAERLERADVPDSAPHG